MGTPAQTVPPNKAYPHSLPQMESGVSSAMTVFMISLPNKEHIPHCLGVESDTSSDSLSTQHSISQIRR